MKINKRIGSIFLGVMVMVMLLTSQVFAQGKIDMSKENSLILTYKYGDTCLEGAEFKMYKVADADEYGVYTTSNAIKKYPIALDFTKKYSNAEWGVWAETLMNLVSADEAIQPDVTGLTNKDGVVTLTAPSAGIYLVIGNPHHQGDLIYKTKAALFTLPSMNNDDNTWTYETKAEPKSDGVPEDAPISLKVKKIWNDSGYSSRRPSEITVELRRDGDLYETVVLNKENGWSHEWRKQLDADANWTVVEKEVPSGYTVSVKKDGITFTITNTTGGGGGGGSKTPKDPTPSSNVNITDHDTPLGALDFIEDNPIPLAVLPQTGTTWWFVLVLACASVIFFTTGYIRNRGCGEDEN